jgi:hypothetical protein
MSRKRTFSLAISAACLIAFLLSGGVAEAKRGPSSVTVCVDSKTAVVSQVSNSAKCVDGIQKWSASKLAPQLCWNASSVDPKSQTRLVSIKPPTGCAAPLRSVPVGKLVLLCADQISGVLRWPVTRACETGNANTWVRVGALSNAAPDTTTTTTAPSAALAPSVSLQATVIRANTVPKAVIVTANVAGTIYFVEGSVTVNSVSDITNAHSILWAQGVVAVANTPTSIAIDVDKVLNGYYRVFVMTAQGVLSSPASNIVTISVPRASQATTTTVVSTCLTGGLCTVGVDVGAGGGTVFYYSATAFTSTGSDCGTNCHYLEAAPVGWIVSSTPTGQTNCSTAGTSTVDPKCEWSGLTTFTGSQISPSTAIGMGKSNTAAIVGQAGGGNTAGKAATAASAYRGGSKSDWFLPSLLELNQLCRYAWALTVDNTATTCTGMTGTIRTGFSTNLYWSSTDYDDPLHLWSQSQSFSDGSQIRVGNSKSLSQFVRPVRAG